MTYGLKVQGNDGNGNNFIIADSTLDLLNYRVVAAGRGHSFTLDSELTKEDFVFVKRPTAINYDPDLTGTGFGPIVVPDAVTTFNGGTQDVTISNPEVFFLAQTSSDTPSNTYRFKGRGFTNGGYLNQTYVTADWDVDMDYFIVRKTSEILDNSSVLNDDEYGLQIRTSYGEIAFDSRALITNNVFNIETYLPPSENWTILGNPFLNHSAGCYINIEWSLGGAISGGFQDNQLTTNLYGLGFGTTQVQYYDSILINYDDQGQQELYQNFRNLHALFAAKLEGSSSGTSQQNEEESSLQGALQFSSVDNIIEGQSISLVATTNEPNNYHVRLFRLSGSDGVAQKDFTTTFSPFTGSAHTATFVSYNDTTSYNVTLDRTGSFTRQSIVDIATGFNRDFIGNTIANYTGDFTGNYTRLSTYTRTSTRTIGYTGDYVRTVGYEGIYTRLSTRNSTRTSTYERNYSEGLSFEGNYSRFYTGTIYYNWNIGDGTDPEGRLEITYRPGTYTETYQRTRPSSYAGNYTRTRIPELSTSKTFTRTSTRTRLSAYSRVSSRTRVSSYERQRPSDFTRTVTYTGNFFGNFLGNFVPQVNYVRYRYSITSTREVPYQRISTRARLSTYDGTYTRTRLSTYTRTRGGTESTRTFVGNYIRGFVGNYTRTITYAGEFARTRVSAYANIVDYFRVRTSAYSGNYGRTFVGNYTRSFEGNYNRDVSYSRTFVGNFAGNASYEGNYQRTRTSTYERTRVSSGGGDPFLYSVGTTPQYVWRLARVAAGGLGDGGRGDITYEYFVQLYYNGTLVYNSSAYDSMADARVPVIVGPVGSKYYHRGTLQSATSFVEDYKIAENTSVSTPTATLYFTGNYTRNFVGNYERIRSEGGSSTRNRVSSYVGTVNSTRNRGSSYAGDYSRSYEGNYTRNFTGNFSGISTRIEYEQGTPITLPAYYSRNFVGDTSRLSTKTSGRVVTRYSTYLKNRVSTYTPGYLGNYQRGFVSEYTGTYNRNFAGQYTGNYERTGFYTRLYTGDYIGASTRQVLLEGSVEIVPVNYQRTSTRTSTRVRDSVFSYAGTFTGNYSRDFGGNFEGNYQRSFVGEYTGDYTGTYSRSPSYEGNYEGNYSRNIVDSYNRYPISYYTRVSSRTDIRVTAFSRVLSFVGEYTGNFTGNYTRDFTDSRSYVRTPSYLGNYANYVPSTRNSTRTSTRDFIRTRTSSYSDGAKTYYTGEFIGNFTKTTTVTAGVGEMGWQGETFRAQLRTGNDTGSIIEPMGSENVEVLAEKEFTLYDNDSGIFATTSNRIVHPENDTTHELSVTHLTEGSTPVPLRVYRDNALILTDVTVTSGLNNFTVNEIPPNGTSYTYDIKVFNGSQWIPAGSYLVTTPVSVAPTSSDVNSEPPPQTTDTSNAGTWWRVSYVLSAEGEEYVTIQIRWNGTEVYASEPLLEQSANETTITTGGFTYTRGDYIEADYSGSPIQTYYQVTRS